MEMLVIALVAILAFAAVLVPLLRRKPGVADDREFEAPPPSGSAAGGSSIAPMASGPGTPIAPGPAQEGARPMGGDVEKQVLRYREALRAGTICRKCGEANPAESVFCAECGTRLPLADAREFE